MSLINQSSFSIIEAFNGVADALEAVSEQLEELDSNMNSYDGSDEAKEEIQESISNLDEISLEYLADAQVEEIKTNINDWLESNSFEERI